MEGLDELVGKITPENAHEDTVVKFHPVEVGPGYRSDPDEILEAAKGNDLDNVIIIGELPTGELWVSSAGNAGLALIMIERAKHRIVFGE